MRVIHMLSVRALANGRRLVLPTVALAFIFTWYASVLTAEVQVAAASSPSKDLTLILTVKGSKTRANADDLKVSVSIKNNGTTTQPIVLPGDGSEAGWREPHFFFTATKLDKDGNWHPVDKRTIGRCGNFDQDWQKSIVTVAKDESKELPIWVFPGHSLAIDDPGTYRLYAHYKYTAGANQRLASDVNSSSAETLDPAKGTLMEGVAPFSLASNPVKIKIAPRKK